MRLAPLYILTFTILCLGQGLSANAGWHGATSSRWAKEKLDNGLSLSGDHVWFLEVDEEETHGSSALSPDSFRLAATFHAAGEPSYKNDWHLQKIFLSLHVLYCTFLN